MISGNAGGVGICSWPTSNALQYGHWKSLQNAIVTGAFASPVKGSPPVFTSLISTSPACGEPACPEPVVGLEPFHITAPAIRSPAATTAAGKKYLLLVSLVSICGR